MQEHTPYTANLVNLPHARAGYIDIQPPFAPGDALLERCGDLTDVILRHHLSTEQFTRIEATPRFNVAPAAKPGYLQRGANFILEELGAADEGRAPNHPDY